LCWALGVILSDVDDDWLFHAGILLFGKAQFDIGASAKTGISGDCNSFFFAESDKSLLSVIGVELNLEDCRLDGGVVTNVADSLAVAVAQTDVFNETILDEFLHGLPGFLHWYVVL